MRKAFLILLASVLLLAPAHAEKPKNLLKRDLPEEIGKIVRLSSDQEDRVAALHGTMLLKVEDVADSFGPLAEQRLGAKLKTKYAKELAAIDAAPESERDARSKALVRKVSVELRAELEREMRGKLRAVATDFFADATKLLSPSQRPKLKAFQGRYLAAWDREKPAEIRRQLDLILGSASR